MWINIYAEYVVWWTHRFHLARCQQFNYMNIIFTERKVSSHHMWMNRMRLARDQCRHRNTSPSARQGFVYDSHCFSTHQRYFRRQSTHQRFATRAALRSRLLFYSKAISGEQARCGSQGEVLFSEESEKSVLATGHPYVAMHDAAVII